jgi:hypothetical protein
VWRQDLHIGDGKCLDLQFRLRPSALGLCWTQVHDATSIRR